MEILREIVDDICDCNIEHVSIGVFLTAVFGKRCGLATTMKDVKPKNGACRIANAGSLQQLSSRELSNYVLSSNLLEASVGMAAVNSCLPDVSADLCCDINAYNIIVKHGAGKVIAVIGHFPFVSRLKDIAKKLYVFSQSPVEGDLFPEDEPELLPRADVVAITGTSLINHTFSDILSFIKKDAYRIILGPSVPLTRILFDYGIDAVCGAIVYDANALIKSLDQGVIFKDLPGKRLVAMMKKK
ncbi:Rossmann-like domain-containing protein [Elusimicrobiota bacterium]